MKLDVDPGQVRAVAAGLHRIHAAVEGLGRRTGCAPDDAGALGSALLTTGLLEVSRNWSSARHRIGLQLEGLARAAEVAASAYSAVDHEVSNTLAGPTPTRVPGR